MPDLTTAGPLLALVALLSYLLGSIPFGIVIARLLKLGDLRQIGSGNIGATNVLRTGNKAAAAATLLLDGAKGAVAVLAARWIAGEDAAQLAGFAAFLGHLFPIFARFRGGKGVATFLGILLALASPIGLACCAVWLLTAALSRISSLSALAAAASSSGWMLVFDHSRGLVLSTILTLLVFYRHSANIRRLRTGTEPRIGRK
ncbi:MAG: glycerol-3-phosphate 1-O-acyltransferase PlsY [Gemmobacter sp.]|jgi:glycerol-3-phosphate acyltransferase PlsY|nr:glycerol-3-phosphate 1-O-acyltransferase PlsY [Gemmobacter sp.]